MQFPDPPLRSVHWEVRKYCELDFVDCVQYLHEVSERHSSYWASYFLRVFCIKYKIINELLLGMSGLFVSKLRHTAADLPKVERGSRLILFCVIQL